jgi:hypothetical protein
MQGGAEAQFRGDVGDEMVTRGDLEMKAEEQTEDVSAGK